MSNSSVLACGARQASDILSYMYGILHDQHVNLPTIILFWANRCFKFYALSIRKVFASENPVKY